MVDMVTCIIAQKWRLHVLHDDGENMIAMKDVHGTDAREIKDGEHLYLWDALGYWGCKIELVKYCDAIIELLGESKGDLYLRGAFGK